MVESAMSEVEKYLNPISHLWDSAMCPQKIRRLPRQTVSMDERGRIVIPKYLREAAGIDVGIEEECWVTVEAHPNLENCKALLLVREY